MAEGKVKVTVDVKDFEAVKKVLARIKFLLSGWDGYAWKDDEYIDDIQECFDEALKEIV